MILVLVNFVLYEFAMMNYHIRGKIINL